MIADTVWKPLCDAKGFRQIYVTRLRGMKPWIQVYIKSLCLECLNPSQYIVVGMRLCKSCMVKVGVASLLPAIASRLTSPPSSCRPPLP